MLELKSKKIFLVDDDLFLSELYNHHFQELGFQDVTVCNEGTTLLALLVQKPDIIFLDYQMDHINGFELLKKVKRFDPNILVVMVSGQDDMNVAIESLKFGAFDYIVKGKKDTENITEVLNRIDTYLSDINPGKPKFHQVISNIFKSK